MFTLLFQLVDFRMVVSQMLGLDVSALALPNYEIIKSLESLLHPHHHPHHDLHHHSLALSWPCPTHYQNHHLLQLQDRDTSGSVTSRSAFSQRSTGPEALLWTKRTSAHPEDSAQDRHLYDMNDLFKWSKCIHLRCIIYIFARWNWIWHEFMSYPKSDPLTVKSIALNQPFWIKDTIKMRIWHSIFVI